LVLYSLGRKQDRGEIIHRIVDANLVDGLIAVYPDGAARPGDVINGDRRVSRYLAQLHEQGFPVVVVDDQGAHDGTPWISSDNRQGAMDAVRYLISLGHRRIAHVTGPEFYMCSRDRLEGYRAALEGSGLTPNRELEVPGDFTASGGRAGADALFALPEPPTAIFAANDDTAYGVLGAARQHGLRVPEDVAVVGFDDAGGSALSDPPLTTVRQPFFETGRRAATAMIALVDAPRTHARGASRRYRTTVSRAPFGATPLRAATTHVQLPVQLVERASTMAPNRSPERMGLAMK
jgi:LacI family transcriptional regulator